MVTSSTSQTPKRQVIFVGGTSYSGSTMLDMMLANGEGGFSCGEVSAAFSPYRKRHFAYMDHAAADGHILWQSIIEAGQDALYTNIFESDSRITRIIDSSKDPIWINDRLDALGKQGIESKNVIVWKRPSEFLLSRIKRGRKRGWQRAWTNYHKMYFRLIQDWCSISYRDLVTDENALSRLCDRLGIPFFSGKEKYWMGSFQTLFGNDSAKVHLEESGTDRDIDDRGPADTPHPQSDPTQTTEKYRLIYYDAPSSRGDHVDVDGLNPRIMRLLLDRDANSMEAPCRPITAVTNDLMCPQIHILLRRFKRKIFAFGLSALESVTAFWRKQSTRPDQ